MTTNIADGTWAGLRVHAAGERKAPRQVVILLHGWGAPGDDLVSLAEPWAAPGRLFLFPEGPLTEMGGGRAWWHLDLARLEGALRNPRERDTQEEPQGLAEIRPKIQALLTEVQRRTGLDAAHIALGGFSQGAMVSVDATLHAPEPPGTLLVLSGTLTAGDVWQRRLQTLPRKPTVLVSHGRQDPVLPFWAAERLRDVLTGAGLPVTWVPFDGGHAIPNVVLAQVARVLPTP